MTYVDDVWAAVPEGAEPEDFAPRRHFLLSNVEPGQRVADVGCGEGAFSAAVLAAGARPIAIDVADEPLRRLRARFPEVEDVRRAQVGESLPLDDDEVDVAWVGEVIEHVVDVGAFCSELRRVVKPDGLALVTTPDHRFRLRAWLALSPRAFARHFSPYSDHVRFFTERSLVEVLADAGFEFFELGTGGGRIRVCAS